MEELKQRCFFCSEEIEEKKTMEHIIPNSLLGKLGIKEETVIGERKTQYSRIKVPSHASCNNEFGSLYEDKILELLEDTNTLYNVLKDEENSSPIMYQAGFSATEIITTWLSKIYYGLFYDDFLKTKDKSWKKTCASILESENFNFVKRSYANGYGFQLPSSLYVFKTKNTKTDLITMVNPSSILFKIKSITLILCVCDGYLTKNYLFGDSLKKLRSHVFNEDRNNIEFPSHKLAFAEILALITCIPKTPKFVYSENQIINMSSFTMAANPDDMYKIDLEHLHSAREEIFKNFNIVIEPSIT